MDVRRASIRARVAFKLRLALVVAGEAETRLRNHAAAIGGRIGRIAVRGDRRGAAGGVIVVGGRAVATCGSSGAKW